MNDKFQFDESFLNDLLNISFPSNPAWSPDGEKIAFVCNKGGRENIWTVSPSGDELTELTDSDGPIGAPNWTKDGKKIIYGLKGHIRLVSVQKGLKEQLTKTAGKETNPKLSPDGNRLAFISKGDIWTMSLKGGELIQLTSGSMKCFDLWGGSELKWSPDGSNIAFTASTAERISESPSYSGSKLSFTRYKLGSSNVGVVPSQGGEVTWLAASENLETNPVWSPNGAKLAITRIGKNHKWREILVVTSNGDKQETLFREEDADGWTSPMSPQTLWSPDGERVLIVSDRDGWDHLYLLSAEGGDLIQLTEGECEDSYPSWSPDGYKIAFASNRGSVTERHLWIIPSTGGEAIKFTLMRGTNIDPLWSPNGKNIVFQHSGPYESLDLWIKKTLPDEEPTQLTRSMPEGIDKSKIVVPNLIWYESEDGTKIPAYLLTPQKMVKGRKYPALVWVHGGGVRQNRYGWHPMNTYAIFYAYHQHLLQKGYVILMVDYRGSIGYGKKFRFGQYLDLGGGDLQDVVKGAEFLKKLDYVDSERVGVWGISYGGYMTLQALVKEPDVFKAGIDIAGVTDWEMYAQDPSGGWIHGRMGLPDEHPQQYRESSPINFVKNLEVPLLILHGTDDINVPFLESVRLIHELIEENKSFEFGMYPGEAHSFTRKESWVDAFRRVDKFLDTHLKK